MVLATISFKAEPLEVPTLFPKKKDCDQLEEVCRVRRKRLKDFSTCPWYNELRKARSVWAGSQRSRASPFDVRRMDRMPQKLMNHRQTASRSFSSHTLERNPSEIKQKQLDKRFQHD